MNVFSPKKILIFSVAYFPLVGGAEVAVREFTERIDVYEFHLITPRPRGAQRRESIGNVTVHRFGGLLGFTIAKYCFPLVGLVAALRLHREVRFDGVWGIMANYAGITAMLFARIVNIPFLLTLQEGDPIAHIKRRALPVWPLFRMTFRRADAVQAISNHLATFGVSMGFGGAPQVVPNGVNIAHFQEEDEPRIKAIRESLGITSSDTVLITVSRLVIKNGVSDIIRALTFLPETTKLIIAGTGHLEKSLRADVASEGLESRVFFVGHIAHDELPAYLHASDIFVRPSLSEGLGNVFLEAMAAGLPVVATPVGGIPDIVTHGDNGLLCEPGNPESCADAIQKIIGDPELEKRLAEKGRVFVDSYDWDALAPRMRIILGDL